MFFIYKFTFLISHCLTDFNFTLQFKTWSKSLIRDFEIIKTSDLKCSFQWKIHWLTFKIVFFSEYLIVYFFITVKKLYNIIWRSKSSTFTFQYWRILLQVSFCQFHTLTILITTFCSSQISLKKHSYWLSVFSFHFQSNI